MNRSCVIGKKLATDSTMKSRSYAQTTLQNPEMETSVCEKQIARRVGTWGKWHSTI